MNREQRVILEKIIKQKLNERISSLRQEESKKVEDAREKNRGKAEEIRKEYVKIGEKREELSKEVMKLGFTIHSYQEDKLSSCYGWKIEEEVGVDYREKIGKIQNQELSLIAKIHGATTEFNELLKELEKEIAKM